ncbi:periphilin-1-like [Polyodon spathula]|uniref:periphilin-1-like n=1 Tax=Polyodon spathula TaxID=7913 RepID=UPI001B7EBE32|nr:periphilin-1-like [Polyodon spathula]
MQCSRKRDGKHESNDQRQKKSENRSSKKHETKDDRRHSRKSRSPLRPPPVRSEVMFRPRFGRPFFKARYFRKEEPFFRTPGFRCRFQRPVRSQRCMSPKRPHATSPSTANHCDLKKDSKCASEQLQDLTGNMLSPNKNNKSLESNFSVKEQMFQQVSPGIKEPSSLVARAALRNRAIQQKRKEIEEVYKQDCETFGIVVKMLIAKDPSLEQSVQFSLQENLKEIGFRCVEAMQDFICDYDSRCPNITTQH